MHAENNPARTPLIAVPTSPGRLKTGLSPPFRKIGGHLFHPNMFSKRSAIRQLKKTSETFGTYQKTSYLCTRYYKALDSNKVP